MTFDDEVTVRYVRYANEQTGWAVLDAAGEDGTPIALVGPLVHLEQGERARIVGDWVNDSRFGPQVKVSEARPLPPQDPATLTSYLQRVKHIGARRAADLVERFGHEEVLDAIDRDPGHAFAQVGLRAARAQEAAESWQKLRVTRRLHLLLAPHGLAYLAPRIHEHHGAGAHELITRDPYQLTSVFGVGFAIADRIARASDPPPAAAKRERAAVMHTLAEAERSGSACLPAETLLADAAQLLGGEPAEGTLDALEADNHIVREEDWVYRRATAELEAELAARIDALISRRAESSALGARRGRAARTPSDCRWPRRADRRAAGGAGGGVRPPPVGDHRRPGHGQDRLDQVDRRARDRARRARDAGGAHRAGGGADDRGQRAARPHRALGAGLDPGRRAHP